MRPAIADFAEKLLSTDFENKEEYHRRYDDLIWVISTSSIEELVDFSKIVFNDRYLNLPPPILVSLFRFLIPRASIDEKVHDDVQKGIAMYCDPVEERNILNDLMISGRRDRETGSQQDGPGF